MVLYEVHRQCNYTKHYSTVCSTATLFKILIYLVIIVAPFFISYATNDFWLRTSTYTEQPSVHFMNQWIVQITTEDSLVPKSWSTYAGLNRLLEDEELAIPIVKSREEDYNFDRINDELFFTLSYDSEQHNVTAVQLLLFFSLEFTSFATVVLQSMIHITSSWSVPSSGLWVAGDLVLYQRDPFPSSGRLTTYNLTFFNDSSIVTEDYELMRIIQEAQNRNISTVLKNSYSVWQSGGTGNFTLNLKLTYPQQTVTYSPGFWQLIKFAWIQYLAVLVVLYVVMGRVQSFVFENNVILTVKLRTDKPHRH